jgi:hypothetical protein
MESTGCQRLGSYLLCCTICYLRLFILKVQPAVLLFDAKARCQSTLQQTAHATNAQSGADEGRTNAQEVDNERMIAITLLPKD